MAVDWEVYSLVVRKQFQLIHWGSSVRVSSSLSWLGAWTCVCAVPDGGGWGCVFLSVGPCGVCKISGRGLRCS